MRLSPKQCVAWRLTVVERAWLTLEGIILMEQGLLINNKSDVEDFDVLREAILNQSHFPENDEKA